MINLWLDDVRPAPVGWVWVTTVTEAKHALLTMRVEDMSLDHDLGACADCIVKFLAEHFVPKWAERDPAQTAEQQALLLVERGYWQEAWLMASDGHAMPHCEHVGTGYDLCLWMAEHAVWPKNVPTVHSANPVGRERMAGVIQRYFPTDDSQVNVGDDPARCKTCGGFYGDYGICVTVGCPGDGNASQE